MIIIINRYIIIIIINHFYVRFVPNSFTSSLHVINSIIEFIIDLLGFMKKIKFLKIISTQWKKGSNKRAWKICFFLLLLPNQTCVWQVKLLYIFVVSPSYLYKPIDHRKKVIDDKDGFSGLITHTHNQFILKINNAMMMVAGDKEENQWNGTK